MVVVDNVNMISVVVVLLCFVHYAGCVSVQSKVSNVDKLKDTNGDLVWIYTKENGEVFVSGSVTLAQIKNGKPVSTTIATITSTVSVTTSPYSGRGWSVSKSSTQVSLSIKGIGVDDDGTYSLVLIYLKGAKTSSDNDNIVLNVLVRPYFPTRNSYTEGKHTLDEGKKFILKCEPEGSPKPIKIDWLKNDVSLRLGKNSDDPNLVFENINRTDDGKYTCQASNTAGIAAKFPISFVDVKYKPVNTKFNYTSVLVDGESGQLKCSAEADPIARYDITGGSISYKDISGTVNLGVVVFTNLNNKIITCLPKNRLGDGPIAQLKLDVQVKPKVLPGYFKDKVNAIHGKNVTIKCRASGKPSPNILWLRDSQPLRNSPRTSVVKFDEILGVYISESILLLAPARRQTDNGRYTCLARNPYGENSRSAVLRLLYRPEITTEFRNREVRVNTKVELTCEAKGEPKVTYYVWRYPNGTKIQNKTVGTLLFPAIQPDEGGRLSCAAGSYLGEGAKKYVHLFVGVPPRIIVPPTQIVSINVSERLLLFCNASGVPQPIIRWSLGNKLLRVEGEVLDISSVKSSDRGTYNCTASNGFTPNANALSEVIVFFAPEIVTNTAAETIKGAQSGTIVQLVCSVKANPLARLEWLYYPSRSPVNITGDQDITNITKINSETIQLEIHARIGAKYLCHAYNNRGNASQLYEIRPKEKSSVAAGGVTKTIIISVIVIATTFLVFVIILVWISVRRNRRKNINRQIDSSSIIIENYISDPSVRNLDEENVTVMESTLSIPIYETPVEHCPYQNDEKPSMQSNWEFERENIIIQKVIGKGSFGEVAKGILRSQSDGKSKEEVVAIKMVKQNCSDSDKKDLFSELQIMKSLGKHPNVIQLLGCVTQTEPLLVVICFVPNGDLLGYLRKSRGKTDKYFMDPDIKPKTDLTSKELIGFARDVASGMEFLSLNKVVHRDLAARNVLVGEQHVCKITDFGMARDVYRDNIYTKKSKGRIPIKWTAYESLMYNQYTTQSDVWSYGILLFEVFTIGGTPYPGIANRDVCSLVEEGFRMEKPKHLNKDLHSVMLSCWEINPGKRPSFSSLKRQMIEMERNHLDYVNVMELNSSLYENTEDFE